MTSRRVVDAVARALGMATVGHAGTLDPLAEGVVVVCVGHATRLVDAVHGLPKHYSAGFLLGRSSPSDDLETPVHEEAAPRIPTRDEVDAALPAFRGDVLQRPCDYSAVHVAGQRAYRLARRGTPVDLPARPVRIERLDLTGFAWPRLDLEIVSSAGTFVRAVGRDLAAALGTRAVMASLVRTAVGPFTRGAALRLDDVTPGSAAAALLPPLAALPLVPRVILSGERLADAVRGGLLDLDDPSIEEAAAVDDGNERVGVLRRHPSGRFRLRPNFRGAG